MSDYDSEDGTPRDNLGTYEGERNADQERHGHGVTVYPNQDRYEGKYKNGKRYGLGVYKFKSGGMYEGSYVLNKKHGFGKFSYKDGGEYQGEWANDKYAGLGVYTYPNEDWYAGEWKDHKKNGQGVYYFHDTKCLFRGEFAAGEFVSGEWLFADGVYEGTFSMGRPLGRGVFKYKNGNVQTGEYVSAGKADVRSWVVDAFSYVDASNLECALDVDGAALRDHYVALYSRPLFSHDRKAESKAMFDKVFETSPAAPAAPSANGGEVEADADANAGEASAPAAGADAEDDDASVPHVLLMDFVASLRSHAVSAWGVPDDYFDQVVSRLPLVAHFSTRTSFDEFWNATQKLPDVVERFMDVVFKAERRDEVRQQVFEAAIIKPQGGDGEDGGEDGAAGQHEDEDEEGAGDDEKARDRPVNLHALLRGLEDKAVEWGYDRDSVVAQLAELDFFADVNEESTDVVLFDDVWEAISHVEVQVVRSVPVSQEAPAEPEPAAEGDGAAANGDAASPLASAAEVVRAAREAIDAAAGDGTLSAKDLRDIVVEEATKVNSIIAELIAAFVDDLSVFARMQDEPDAPVTAAEFWEAFEFAAAAASAGQGDGASSPAAILVSIREAVSAACVPHDNGNVKIADLRATILEQAAAAGADDDFASFVDSLPFMANFLAMDEDERDALEGNLEEFWATVEEAYAAANAASVDVPAVLSVVREDVENELGPGEDGLVSLSQLRKVLLDRVMLVSPSDALASQIEGLPAFAQLDAMSEDERDAVQIALDTFWDDAIGAGAPGGDNEEGGENPDEPAEADPPQDVYGDA